MAKNALISVDMVRTLAHVALLSAWEGDGNTAERIFVALQATEPKEPNIRICRAMVFACRDKYPESLALLDEVLGEEPDNMSAKSLLGFVKFTTGAPGWQALLEEVIADGSDKPSVELAKDIFTRHREYPKPSVGPDERNPFFIHYA